MGAWSEDAFGNDTACDWAGDFCDDPSMDRVVQALNEVFADDYIDSDVGAEALAACEVIARLQGHFGYQNAYTEDIDAWCKGFGERPTEEHKDLAVRVIERLLGEDSELQELWDEDGENQDWHQEMESLRARITG